ncbi:Uncharacterized conserved protein, DUF952 family [Paracoccus sp. J56]|nr:Uncharacterized conserved protein, DUF952 family [Paracoccus sp. J56]
MALDGPHGATHEPTMLVYKIFHAAEFQAFTHQGHSLGAPVDLADGYIHLSTATQLPGTLSRHFAGKDGLHLLALDSRALDALRWEPSRGGDLFPHLYRELRANDVLWSRPLPLGPSGHDIGDIT